MRKIINISSFSRSRVNQDPIAGSFYGWHSQYGREVHQRLGLRVESWSIDAGIFRRTVYDREGVQYRIFPARFFLAPGREISFGLIRALRSEMREHDVIVHLHDFHNWQSYAIALALPKAKIVAHYHGATKRPLERMRNIRKWPFFPLFLLEQVFESMAVRRIKHFFLANTQDHRYYEHHGLSFSFCPMAPDLKFFHQLDRTTARKKLKLDTSDLIVLNIGGFAQPKNLGLLVAAFDRVRQARPARLFIIGPTYQRTYRQAIESMIDQFGLRSHVTILDFLPKSELNIYYNAADVLGITSNQDEGGPTVALEAITLGLPVVSTPVGFTHDIVNRTKGMLRLADATPDSIATALLKAGSTRVDHQAVSVWTWEDVMQVVQPMYGKIFRS